MAARAPAKISRPKTQTAKTDPDKSHTDSVYALAFDPSGHYLASGGRDAAAMLWRLTQGDRLEIERVITERKRSPCAAVIRLAFGPRWGEVVLLSQGAKKHTWHCFYVHVWEVVSNRAEPLGGGAFWKYHARDIAASPLGGAVAVAAEKAELLDPAEGKWEEPFGKGPARAVAFSPDGTHLAVARDESVTVYEAASRKPVRPRFNHGAVRVAFLDRRMLVTGDEDGVVRLCNVEKGKVQQEWSCGGPCVSDLFPLADGRVVSAHLGDDRITLRGWSTRSTTPRGEHTFAEDVTAVAVSRDGRLVATGSGDGTITVAGLESVLPGS